ncbi:hypothetical protein ACI2LF_29370 [Kribbella sp. NPDC020789]
MRKPALVRGLSLALACLLTIGLLVARSAQAEESPGVTPTPVVQSPAPTAPTPSSTPSVVTPAPTPTPQPSATPSIVTPSPSAPSASVPAEPKAKPNAAAADDTCPATALAQWGAALPIAADRGTAASECFTVTTGAFGMYAWRFVQASQNWNPTLTVFDTSGSQLYRGSASNGFGIIQLFAAKQYRLEISGNVGANPTGYQLGLFELASGGSCPTASSTAFGTTPLTGVFATGAELTCRQLTESAGSQLRVDTQSTTPYIYTSVFDSSGDAVCGWAAYSSVNDCRLTGTAPYRLVTRSSTWADAVPSSYQIWADNLSSAQGCTTSALTSWNTAPAIASNRPANAADCYLVPSAGFGQYVVRVTQENAGWTARIAIYDPGGSRIYDTSAGYSSVELKAGLTYRVIVYGDPSGYPAGYSVAVSQVNGSAGCPAVASTAWNSTGTAISLPTGQELDCRQFGDAQGSTLRLKFGSADLYAEVFNAAGTSVCTIAPTSDAFECRLTGTAPWRIVTRSGYGSSDHDPANGTLWAYNIASTTGCAAKSLGTWQQSLPVATDRSAQAADCVLVTSDTFGDYAFRYVQDNNSWSGRVTIYEPTGARIYSSSAAYTTVQLKASTVYRVLFTGEPNGYPPGVRFGLYRLTGGGTCPVLTDVGWGAPAISQTFDAGPELGCRELPGSSGTTLRITAPSNSDGHSLRGLVYNGAGAQLCDTSYASSGVSCTLTGAAPYRLITRADYSWSDDSGAGTYQFWVNDFGSASGCGSVDATVPITAPAAEGTLAPATAGSCWVSGLVREDRAWLSLVATTSSNLRVTLFSGNGQSICAVGSGSHTNCALTQPGPYKLVVTGPQGDDSGYRVALRRTNNPVGCQRVEGVASGIAPQYGDLGGKLACFRFAEAAGDQMNFTATNPVANGNPAHSVEVYSPNGTLVCTPRPWYSSPQCTFDLAGDHTAIVSEDGYPGKFVFSSICVNPACGPDVLTLAGVTPQRVGAAAATTVTVQGKALSTSLKVELVRGTTRITGQPLAVSADGRELQVAFNLSAAVLGLYDVVGTSTADGSVRVNGVLTVEGVRPAHLETGLVTLGRFVANRPQTVSVTVRNTGNVDALGAPITLDGLPAGSIVTPRFDLVGADGVDAPVRTTAWTPARSVYTGADGKLGVPLVIGRIPAGGSHQYDFTVTVPGASDYQLSVLSSDCLGSSSAPPSAAADSVKDSCADAVLDVVIDWIPFGDCYKFAFGLEKTVIANLVDHAPPYEISSASELFSHALGGAQCAAEFIPGSSVILKVLDGASRAKNIITAGQKCFGGQSASQTSVASLDPNELVGPAGGGPAHAVTSTGTHTFAVYFENAKSASAPAQEVRVTDHLNPAQYDLSTLRFGAVQFGTTRWTPASESTTIGHTLELGDGLQLDMQASYDAQGAVSWILKTEDILTGALPEDPLKGFLPPNVDGTEGQGVLYFTVTPKVVADGAVLSSRADIVFDLNAPIATNTWTNLVDNTVPTAKATAPASVTAKTFSVAWSGSDATSGISSYDVVVATDNGPYTSWKQGVAAGSATYTGVAGHVYRFSAIAHDVAGNVSLLPPTPHATTAVRDASSLTIGKAATIRYGASLTVSTQAKDVATGAVLAKVPVTLYKRTATTGAWTKVVTVTTGTTGVASSTQAPKTYTQYMWSYAGDATHAAASSSGQAISVAQLVSIRATASTVRRGSTVKLYGAATPAVVNQTVTLQRLVGSTWTAAGTAKQLRQRMPNGTLTTGYIFTLKFSTPGTYTYRVAKPAVPGLAAATSSSVALRVT